MEGDIQFNNPYVNNKKKSKKILVISTILLIFIITAIGAYYLFINSKSNNLPQGIAKVSENESLQVNNQDKEIAEKIKQMEAQRRPNPPQSFLSINISKLPSNCSLDSSVFTEKTARYHYKCSNPTPYYLNFTEESDKSMDNEVKIQTESKIQNLKKIKDFSFQNVKGVIVGTFEMNDTQLKNPMEYRLYWMHGNNLITIHTTNVLVFTPDKLIELLNTLK